MDNATWELAKRVFQDALEVTGPERSRVVDASCGDNAEVRTQVEALLTAHEEAGNFLSEVTVAPACETSGSSGAGESDQQFLVLQSTLAGRYSLERELGRGGMGVVYLARDLSLDRPVAIKVLSTDLGGRVEARERFLREARTSAGLFHPNIVPVHAVEEQGDLAFFVMGFVDGETIRERVRRKGPMPVGEAVRMLQEVAWALSHAHGRGVVHRDIKPDNIILEIASGRAMVTDFGIARTAALPGLTAAGLLLGTPEYVSPEQGLGGEVDGRSDMYSLGLTCFFALTGRLPFEAKSVPGMLTKHLEESPSSVIVFRPDVPRKLARALDRCLERDPEDRFGTADELAEAVSEARAQIVEVPAAIRHVRRELEGLVMDAVGWGSISAILFLDWLFLGDDPTLEWGLKIGVYLLAIGLVGSGAVRVITTSRAAIARGFRVDHLKGVLLGRTPDADPRSRGREISGLRSVFEASAYLALFVLLALGYVFGLWDGENPVRGVLRPWYFFAMTAWSTSLLVLPVFVGRSFAARAIRNWKTTRGLWAALWQGPVGWWVFRLAGSGLAEKRQPPPPVQATEALVAEAAANLFGSLPPDYQSRLGELPELVARLEAAADALRRREAELERALAEVGAVASRVDRRLRHVRAPNEPYEDESVQVQRARVVEELDSARILIGARLAEIISALENVRLGLLRLQAGVGTTDELSQDLRAARAIRRDVEALLDGERRVDELLSESQASTDSAAKA